MFGLTLDGIPEPPGFPWPDPNAAYRAGYEECRKQAVQVCRERAQEHAKNWLVKQPTYDALSYEAEANACADAIVALRAGEVGG